METTKVEMLERAFSKAVDLSVNSIAEPDLQECFGDLKLLFGGTLQNKFVNMISKASRGIEDSFKRINEEIELEAQLRRRADMNIAGTMDETDDEFSPIERLKPLLTALKHSDAEDLARGIKILETETKKAKEQAGRLRTQLFNEVDAINLENMKIKHATQQFADDI